MLRSAGIGEIRLRTSMVAARDARRFWSKSASDRVRSSVRPLNAASSEAADRYGDLRMRSKSHWTGFSDPDLFDHFAHPGRRLLTLPLAGQ